MQVWLNFMDVRCIKCTCKEGDWTSFSGKIKKKVTRPVFLNSTKVLILAKVHFSPSSFNFFQLNL